MNADDVNRYDLDMRYQVAIGNSLADLVEKVNGLIDQGWKPIGGVSQDGDSYYLQAMIKEPKRIPIDTGPR